MAIKTTSAEETSRRWTDGCARAVREAVEHPASKRQYDWGLSFAAGDIRTIIRRNSGQPMITLSRHHLKEGQLESADKVRIVVLPEGGLAVLPATPEELEACHRALTDCPPPTFPEPPRVAHPDHCKKVCPDCGKTFQAPTARFVYCDTCLRSRKRANRRRYWQRRGKQPWGYQRKLKPREAYRVECTLFPV